MTLHSNIVENSLTHIVVFRILCYVIVVNADHFLSYVLLNYIFMENFHSE
jgi:hypothetical protein